MIKANEAYKLTVSNTAKEREEVAKDLDAAIRAACQLGQRKINYLKTASLISIGFEIARDNGYSAQIVKAVDQRDHDYLVVEW